MKIREKNRNRAAVSILATVVLALSCLLFFDIRANASDTRIGTVQVSGSLNFRSGPGTSYSFVRALYDGDSGTIIGEKNATNGVLWYNMTVDGVTGWASSDYIQVSFVSDDVTTPDTTGDEEFEAYLSAWGFPESYKPQLRKLHSLYPNWVFEAQHTGLTWEEVIAAEGKVGTNLVHKSEVNSMKSVEEGAYDWTTGTWYEYDSGGWIAASVDMVEYAMDPRNFLDETSIFQFIKQAYDPSTMTSSQIAQKKRELAKMVKGTYLEGNCDSRPYVDVIMEAAAESGCCPIILASAMIQEQGENGTGSCISGTVSGYENLYNYFNIGAFKSSTMSAIQRGLWYAKGSGVGATSYGRPWNTREKAIIGGACYYSDQYVKRGQDTIYLKKFNVQGSSLYKHQYMTNVQGAISEGCHVSQAYDASARKSALVFKIPVYVTMPDTTCSKPTDNPKPEAMTGSWKENTVGRWYQYKDGSWPAGKWAGIYDSDEKIVKQYYFNSSGYVLTGWQNTIEAGKWYYLDASGAMETGWQKINDVWYYFSGDGVMKTGWQYIGRKWYFFEDNGVWDSSKARNQWLANTIGWWYQYADGSYPKSCWKQIDENWYYFNSNGYRHIGWLTENGTNYYFNKLGVWIPNAEPSKWVLNSNGWWYRYPDGTYPKEQWEEIDGKTYYFDANGYVLTGWQEIDGTRYYFDASGAMHTGWLNENGSYYYLDAMGEIVTNWLQVGEKWYYFDVSGVMVTSQWVGNYYLQADGTMATNKWIGQYYVGANGLWDPSAKGNEWVQNSVGWWYRYTDGTYPVNQWKEIDDKWYYFDAYGYRKTGWLLLDGIYYYLNADGVRVENQWIGYYYLQEDGTMATNKWIGQYYVGANGCWIPNAPKGQWMRNHVGWWYRYTDGTYPVNQWEEINGKKYYFGDYGYMKTNWLLLDNTWYYLDASGAMVTNRWIGNYYLQADGTMATNKWIGQYYVGANGCWIP